MTTTLTSSTTDTSPTQDEVFQAYAVLFVKALDSDQKLKQKWVTLIQKIKEKLDPNNDKTYTEGLTIIDNFLANNGYYTNGSSVLALIKDPWYQQHLAESQPNADSDRFVQALFANPQLLADWQTALNQATNGNPTDAADQFLQAHHYNCNPAQVKNSFLAMRNQKLGYWSGIYGAAVLNFQDGTTKPLAPVLIVYGDDKLGFGQDKLDWELNNVQYDQGILSWSHDDFGTITHDGKITFNHISLPPKDDPYIGSEYFGTITFTADDPNYPNQTASIMGRIGKPPQSSTTPGQPPKTPPTVNLSVVDQVFKYAGFVLTALFLGDMLLVKTGALKSAKEFFLKIKDKFSGSKDSVDVIEKTTTTAEESVSKIPKSKTPAELASGTEYGDGTLNDQGLDGIANEELPPADSVAKLEETAEKIDAEGKVEQSPEDVASPTEGEGTSNAEAEAGESESVVEELGESIGKFL